MQNWSCIMYFTAEDLDYLSSLWPFFDDTTLLEKYTTLLHYQIQGSIDFNTANIHRTVVMYYTNYSRIDTHTGDKY